jgi:hypothetical protein
LNSENYKVLKLSNIGCRFRETTKTHIEIPVDILEFVSCETPLQSEYSRRVNKFSLKGVCDIIL